MIEAFSCGSEIPQRKKVFQPQLIPENRRHVNLTSFALSSPGRGIGANDGTRTRIIDLEGRYASFTPHPHKMMGNRIFCNPIAAVLRLFCLNFLWTAVRLEGVPQRAQAPRLAGIDGIEPSFVGSKPTALPLSYIPPGQGRLPAWACVHFRQPQENCWNTVM